MSKIVKYSISDIVAQLQNNQVDILADVNEPMLLAKILSLAFPHDKPSFAFSVVIGNTYYAQIKYHFLDPRRTPSVSWSRLDPASDKSKKDYFENLKNRAIPDSKDHATIVPPGYVSLSNISKK